MRKLALGTLASLMVLSGNVKSRDLEGIESLTSSADFKLSGEDFIYAPDGRGNIFPDFSYVGYKQGLEPIPDVPVAVTLNPSSGDDGARIQAALDEVGNLPLINGVRGGKL